MEKGVIKLCYQRVIGATPPTLWDQYVFEDTYKEFFMQAQQFDKERKYATFKEMLQNIPKADQMHYLVSTAAIGYIRQLNETIPWVLNTGGKPCLSFKNFRFEVLQSHIAQKDQHKIAIYFYSEPITWIGTVGSRLLFAQGDCLQKLRDGQEIETDMLELSPELFIASIKTPWYKYI